MPTRAASGASSSSTASVAVREALTDARGALGGARADFGLLFASPKLDMTEVLELAATAEPGVDFVGCTTAGEITERGMGHGGLSAMLIAQGEGGAHLVEHATRASDVEGAVATLSGRFFDTRRSGAGVATTVLLVDGMSGTGEAIVDGLRRQAGGLLHEIVGGAAGDEGAFAGTYVGAGTRAGVNGAVALHVTSPTRWGVGVDHGLSPATKPMRVTRARANVVHELDGRPAFEVYREYAQSKGVELAPADASGFLINNELGVLIFDQLKKARAPLSVGEDGSLTCAAEIPSGASVCILGGGPDELAAAARRAATEAKERLGGKQAAGVLLFDCICRGAILGDQFHRELDAVRDVFPDAPIAGFLTYGEIARYSGRLDGWHNTTAVVAAIPA